MIQLAILCLASFANPQSGAVSTAERHATQVGLDILAQGGNAVDAAVAIHFALAVTYPNAGNIGGADFLFIMPPMAATHFLTSVRQPQAQRVPICTTPILAHQHSAGWP